MIAIPFTPLHLGPALLFGLPLRRYLHAPTFIVANVIVDIEPFLVLLLALPYPLHGYLHTFLSASLLGIGLGYLMFMLEAPLHPYYKMLLLEGDKRPGLRSFMAAGVSGTMLHVLLDAPLYSDIRPFYPITTNPLYNPSISLLINGFCIFAGIVGIIIYIAVSVYTLYAWMRDKH